MFMSFDKVIMFSYSYRKKVNACLLYARDSGVRRQMSCETPLSIALITPTQSASSSVELYNRLSVSELVLSCDIYSSLGLHNGVDGNFTLTLSLFLKVI